MQLVTLPDGHQLDAPAAAALLRAVAAGCPLTLTSAYRDAAEQQRLRNLYLADPKHNAYALPPAQSIHCQGNAIDIAGAGQTWMRAHGAAYGWAFTGGPKEPWHFEYQASTDQHQENDMADGFTEPDRGALTVLYKRVNQAPTAGLLACQGDITIVLAQIAALNATVGHLAAGQGADPAAIRQAAEEGAKAALANLTLTVKEPQ